MHIGYMETPGHFLSTAFGILERSWNQYPTDTKKQLYTERDETDLTLWPEVEFKSLSLNFHVLEEGTT